MADEIPVFKLEVSGETIEVPSELPLLPVRNTVVFPSTTRPLNIGRPLSVAARAFFEHMAAA